MQVQQGNTPNQWHIQLGPVERWVVAGVFALAVFLLGFVFRSFSSRLDAASSTMQTILISQAVTNSQLQQLSTQLSDVPGLTRQMAELQVQTSRNASDIHELQQQRERKP